MYLSRYHEHLLKFKIMTNPNKFIIVAFSFAVSKLHKVKR